jgi:predicted transglutaminase-like protease
MYDAIIHKTICKTNQQAGKKAFCGHDKRRKNYTSVELIQ